jgi:hypothetical protein
MSRGLLAALTAVCVAFAPCGLVRTDPAQAEPVMVKSSKSNSSDRMGGGGGRSVAHTQKVKSSKSNSSDRMGGGGGGRTVGGGAVDKAINLNSGPNSNY